MDPVLRSLVWDVGLMVLITLTVLIVVQLRRRFTAADEPATPVAGASRADWIGLLTALSTDRVPAREWITLAPGLAGQVLSCPGPLRTPLIAALDGAISRCNDPLARASMTQLRRALAALTAA
ncbi:MAG TPA: hypothetical protein VHX44_15660 [Planctomycetota bacterium]|nr:hypothetical protein [Planctomycetota bacterium]